MECFILTDSLKNQLNIHHLKNYKEATTATCTFSLDRDSVFICISCQHCFVLGGTVFNTACEEGCEGEETPVLCQSKMDASWAGMKGE